MKCLKDELYLLLYYAYAYTRWHGAVPTQYVQVTKKTSIASNHLLLYCSRQLLSTAFYYYI